MAYHWAPLAEGQTPRIYAPGQLIYLQGTEADVFYYLLSGKARSYISSASGGERVLATHRSGDLMGEASFLTLVPGCPPLWRSRNAVWSRWTATAWTASSVLTRVWLSRCSSTWPARCGCSPATWIICPSSKRTAGWPAVSSHSRKRRTAPCTAPMRSWAPPWA